MPDQRAGEVAVERVWFTADTHLECPVLVATAVTYCVTHHATDHDDGRAWTVCRFRQLFYFENPMDEHTVLWSDEIAAGAP
jgi:hypothetical protein